MIPLKRAFDENRRLVIPVAAALALNVMLFVGVVYPLRARVQGAEEREQAALAALTAAQREDQSARGLVQGKTQTDTALHAFYKEVLPASLASARGLTYLRLAQLAEENHLRSPHRSAAEDVNSKGALTRVRIEMALEGNYDDVRHFIYQLETGPDFVVIDGVTLTQSGDSSGPLQLTLNLSTYYKHGT